MAHRVAMAVVLAGAFLIFAAAAVFALLGGRSVALPLGQLGSAYLFVGLASTLLAGPRRSPAPDAGRTSFAEYAERVAVSSDLVGDDAWARHVAWLSSLGAHSAR